MDYQQDTSPAYDPQAPQAAVSKEECTWAMLAHLSTLLGFVGIPLANIIAPLVIWLIKKDTMPLVDDQGKEALNFQISLMIYGIVKHLLMLVVVGFFLLGALLIFDIVFTVIAAMNAQKGIAYRYPMTIRFL